MVASPATKHGKPDSPLRPTFEQKEIRAAVAALTGDPVKAWSSALATLVTMAMRVEITRGVPRMIMVLAGHFLLPLFVAMTMLVQVAGLMAGVIVVLAGLLSGLLRHGCLLEP